MTTIVVTAKFVVSDKRVTTDTYFRDGTVVTTYRDDVEKVMEYENFFIVGSGSSALCSYLNNINTFMNLFSRRSYKFLHGLEYHDGISFRAKVSSSIVLIDKGDDRILEMVVRTWRLPFNYIFAKVIEKRVISFGPRGWLVVGSGADYAAEYLEMCEDEDLDLDFDDMFRYISERDESTGCTYDIAPRNG